MTETLQLYWQPGCTSCLRTREFLTEHAVPFESFNVRENDDALRRLAALGLRSVPVLLRGAQYVFAQDLDEVAAFVGLPLQREHLSADSLLQRLQQLLAVATELTLSIPTAYQGQCLPGRERTWLDLAYHIPMIVTAFLDAADGGVLSYDYYERTPSDSDRSAERIAAIGQELGARLRSWSETRAGAMSAANPMLTTYFGSKPLLVVLERTAWHVAQHCRQLEELLLGVPGSAPVRSLTPEMLAGLPLPRNVWDPEYK
jgi:glutaredoxin